MKQEKIDFIRAYSKVHLDEDLHSRHLDDCVQYILLRLWESHTEGKNQVKFQNFFQEYLRHNGLGLFPGAGLLALELAYEHEDPYLKRRSPTDDEVWDKGHGFTNERYLDEVFWQVQEALEILRIRQT